MDGLLLSDDALNARYINYIREFVEKFMTDKAFQDQIHNHIEALQDDFTKEPWGFMAQGFSIDLSQYDHWLHMIDNGSYTPFLSKVQSRSSWIKNQLQALDAGSFSRDLMA